MIQCINEKQMLALFEAQIKQLDPDVLVCHDTSNVLDLLIQRMSKLTTSRVDRPRLGRLKFSY